MVLPKKGAQRRDSGSGEWRRRSTGTVNHNKKKMCLDLTVCFPIFSRVAEIFLQWHQQAFAACGLPKIDPEYPGAHLQWESVSDTWQLFLEMCSVNHTAHSGCAVGLTGLKMTFSLPFNPHHQLGNLSWRNPISLLFLEKEPWCSLHRLSGPHWPSFAVGIIPIC